MALLITRSLSFWLSFPGAGLVPSITSLNAGQFTFPYACLLLHLDPLCSVSLAFTGTAFTYSMAAISPHDNVTILREVNSYISSYSLKKVKIGRSGVTKLKQVELCSGAQGVLFPAGPRSPMLHDCLLPISRQES